MTLSGFIAGCGSLPERDNILREARETYAQAKANPNTANIEARYDAKKNLESAENAKDVEEMKHFAYLAHRQAQRTIAVAERKALEAERERLVKQKEQLLRQAREQGFIRENGYYP
ncbi:MAG: hypothetical protein DRR19_12725 [Candidatus Parabeggiatoa sp. nov. 1]|nr:MAG: hypothetical protein DRR19_12725 [Gammaproteobacteria bacterium]